MEGGGYFTDLMNDGNYDLPLYDLSSLALDDLSSPIEEQSSPIPDSTPSARPNQKRSKNFSEKEDTMLVSAWLNISMDPVHGTNQSRGAFWKRIHDYFHNHKDFVSDRSQSSLQHRWSAIQECVNKLCGCLSQIEGRNQSGVTIQDKLVQALTVFKNQDKDKKGFQFMHCWKMLRNQPKWNDKRKQITTQKLPSNKKQKASMDSSPGTSTVTNTDTSNNATSDKAPAETDTTKRPMGTKQAKELLRRQKGESSVQSLDHLWEKREADAEKEQKKEERYKQSYALEKEKLELEQRRVAKTLEIKENELQFKRMLEDERIVSIDITSMPPLQQQFYKSLQSEIMTRRFPT